MSYLSNTYSISAYKSISTQTSLGSEENEWFLVTISRGRKGLVQDTQPINQIITQDHHKS